LAARLQNLCIPQRTARRAPSGVARAHAAQLLEKILQEAGQKA
jgi:hypothetical protein